MSKPIHDQCPIYKQIRSMICINKMRETYLWKKELFGEAASNFTTNIKVSQVPRLK